MSWTIWSVTTISIYNPLILFSELSKEGEQEHGDDVSDGAYTEEEAKAALKKDCKKVKEARAKRLYESYQRIDQELRIVKQFIKKTINNQISIN